MLRSLLTTTALRSEKWRVSLGSAAVLGLCEARLDVPPTTAYIMLGPRCRRNCAFCAQARTSTCADDSLSRVRWPAYAAEQVLLRIHERTQSDGIRRVCFQVTAGPGHVADAVAAVCSVREATGLPVGVSIAASSIAQIDRLLEAGAQRVTIALDAVTPDLYAQIKGGSWQRAWNLLFAAARRYPGAIGTHLIVGLGETERQMIETWRPLHEQGISVGLFAFTPVPGTALAARNPPNLDSYRRIQVARHLLTKGLVRADDLTFTPEGRLIGLGLPPQVLQQTLADGEAFRTAGCPDCNRPYYNERPGGPVFNYPRPLRPDESVREIRAVLDGLALSGRS